MLEMQMGKAIQILSERDGVQEILLEMDHPIKKAVNYTHITGKAEAGDVLYLNTTAASLSLGTGGYHFVLMNASKKNISMTPGGHGMKLRYTPFQVKVSFTEEEDSDAKEIYNSPVNLSSKLVFFGELHSMIPPLCAYIRYFSGKKHRIAYIMTDHGALPLAFSKNIAFLKKYGMLDITVTIGSAFGGDYECVNIYTGLQTAAHVANCDIILIAMGPGIAGTGTRYGFSGLDMGFYLDLAYHLGGQSWYIPRISFADRRNRHYGLSHHSLTILEEITRSPVPIVLPVLKKEEQRVLHQQLSERNLLKNRRLFLLDGSNIRYAMDHYRLTVTTMGRGIDEDPAFFYAIGAAARKGLSLI
jgi:hypothetical protein